MKRPWLTTMMVSALAALIGWTSAPMAATVTSSFEGTNWLYTYTVTPLPGESVWDFHVAATYDDCDPTHYINPFMPPGWNLTVHHVANTCWISWWTTTNPLPVGTPSSFGYTHYCIPCCHTWVVTESGTDDPRIGQFDGSYNHLDEPCNIPTEWWPCPENDGGLVVSPSYPNPTPVDGRTWGNIKALFR